MRRAITHFQAHHWPIAEAKDSLTLDFDARHRRRIVLTTDGGEEVLLDLERAVAMAHADGLQLDDGEWISVLAAAEPVVEVAAAKEADLLRLTWHIGNRHLPAEITAKAIYIRPDAVIEAMLSDLGATLKRRDRSFQPERGAYGQGKHDSHSHDHGPHGHDERHSHED
jgi:urease accessory protein